MFWEARILHHSLKYLVWHLKHNYVLIQGTSLQYQRICFPSLDNKVQNKMNNMRSKYGTMNVPDSWSVLSYRTMLKILELLYIQENDWEIPIRNQYKWFVHLKNVQWLDSGFMLERSYHWVTFLTHGRCFRCIILVEVVWVTEIRPVIKHL